MGAFSSMNSRRRQGSLPEQQKPSVQSDFGEAALAVGTKAAEEYRDHIGPPAPTPDSQKN